MKGTKRNRVVYNTPGMRSWKREDEPAAPAAEPTEPAAQPDSGVVVALRTLLDEDRANQRREFEQAITAARRPERGNVPDPVASVEPTAGPIVSRNQPSDPLYRRMHSSSPASVEVRSADQDHWGAEFIRGLATRDKTRQQVAADRLNELSDQRAVTTYSEGALDTNTTGILTGSGASLLPQNLSSVIEIARDEVAVLPGIVQNLQLTSATLRVPTASAFVVEMAAEGATSDEAGPTFASVMLKAQKMSGYAKLSVEMLADSAFNVMNILSSRAGSAMGALEDEQICTSNGTPPNISGALVGGDVSNDTALTFEELVALYYALGKVYRTNSVWLANSVTLTLLSSLMDANDHPILRLPGSQVNVISDAPGAIGMIFGKPVYEVPFADGYLCYGDPSGYVFARRQGITGAASEHADFSSELVNFRFTQRIDGEMVDTAALKSYDGLVSVA